MNFLMDILHNPTFQSVTTAAVVFYILWLMRRALLWVLIILAVGLLFWHFYLAV